MESEADLLPAQADALSFAHAGQVLPIDQHLALRGAEQGSQDGEHGGFTRAAGSHQCDKFAMPHAERDTVNGVDVPRIGLKSFDNLAYFKSYGR